MNQITTEMNISQNQELIERVIKLAEKKATGTPCQLSDKLGISVRSLYRILDFINDSDRSVSYSRTLQSYILE